MPVHTRRAGAPEGGFQQLSPPKRKRRADPQPAPPPPQAPLPQPPPPPQPIPQAALAQPQRVPLKDLIVAGVPSVRRTTPVVFDTPCPVPASANTDSLKAPRATPSRKREHDGSSEDEPMSKRVQSEPRHTRAINLFDPNRERSRLLQPRNNNARLPTPSQRKTQSARKPVARKLSPSDPIALLNNLGPKSTPRAPSPQQQTPSPVETPSRQSYAGALFGSVRRGIGRMIFGQGESPNTTPPVVETNPFEITSLPRQPTRFGSRIVRPSARLPKKPPTTLNHATVEDSTEDEEFVTTQVEDSNKRKMASSEQPPAKKPRILNADENGNPTGAYGLTDEMLNDDGSDEEDEEQPQEPTITSTPGPIDNFDPFTARRRLQLKSAMKSGAKSPKKVEWAAKNQVATFNDYPNFGPAGQYTGTLFRFADDPVDETGNTFTETPSASLNPNDASTPSDVSWGKTQRNTEINIFRVHQDSVLTRPAYKGDTPEATAGPSVKITNKDGHFTVPGYDDDTESSIQDDTEETPIPSAPKIPHAALPGSDERLNKARQEAQQYKPKQSSRLAQVEPARSRSSSPPLTRALNATTTPNVAEKMLEAEKWASNLDTPDENTYEDPAQANEKEAEEMRKAEEWAANLAWPEPVSYVDAGLCSEYIDGLIRSRWTEEDDRIVHEFWDKEFDDVQALMVNAKAQGKTVELVI